MPVTILEKLRSATLALANTVFQNLLKWVKNLGELRLPLFCAHKKYNHPRFVLNRCMKHFIYKTTHTNGKYYIGRHSTINENDGYLGSGKWVRGIKDKSTLSREILTECETFEELVDAEEELLIEHINDPFCMNMNTNSVGLVAGGDNPMKNPEYASKISGDNHYSRTHPEKLTRGDSHWMNKNNLAKEEFINNHPLRKPENRAKASARRTELNRIDNPSTKRAAEGKHHWQNGKAPNAGGKQNRRLVEEGRHNFQGPEHNRRMIEEGKNPWVGSTQNEKMLAEGKHPSQIKKTCEHCGKTVSKGMYKRWHGDNCKNKP